MVDETVYELNEGGRLEKDEASGVKVVSERTKRLRPQPDLGTAFPLGR